MMKRTAVTLLAVAAILAPAALTPTAAQPLGVTFSIGTPPPAPAYEVVPAPRPGYAWAPGFWRWENVRHVWVPGHWIVGRPGYHWVADRWIEGPRGGWHYHPGFWSRG